MENVPKGSMDVREYNFLGLSELRLLCHGAALSLLAQPLFKPNASSVDRIGPHKPQNLMKRQTIEGIGLKSRQGCMTGAGISLKGRGFAKSRMHESDDETRE